MRERARRGPRRARRDRRNFAPETREPVTKWFESDALPEDGRASPETSNSKSLQRGPVPPVAVRSRAGRHRLKERRPILKRSHSPRRAAQRRLRREARGRAVKKVGGIVALVAGVGAVAWWQLSSGEAPIPRVTQDTSYAAAEATTTLLVGSETEGGGATWLALLSFDPAAQSGAIVYIPAHTAVEVPGRGLQPLGQALESGDMSLLMVSAESLLRIDIDHFEQITSAGAEALFAQIGPLTVDVPKEVRLGAGENNTRLLFTEGTQELGPTELVDFLYAVGLEGDDVELGARHLAFWDGLLDDFRANPPLLGASVTAVGESLGSSNATASENARLMESLAALRGEDLTLTILPVRQVGVGGAELYEADAEEVTAFIEQTLPSSGGTAADIEVQVLNGNGRPGIGQRVAEALVGEGFRVALSGNARSFKHETTEIITYDPAPGGLAAARWARDLLGVGKVLVSAQEQGIVSVDLTIVVGKDFLRKR